ncbi:unnamed protein product [Protopolystoma xenopodis]|uniref:Uncharacterized protein n=1 Tax=Protopolystoma xenopodis TaxID=117903 RepID=A0A3S5ADG9_9PLAT|nr:unnamed protein product [Protopolystoma xenopodis]
MLPHQHHLPPHQPGYPSTHSGHISGSFCQQHHFGPGFSGQPPPHHHHQQHQHSQQPPDHHHHHHHHQVGHHLHSVHQHHLPSGQGPPHHAHHQQHQQMQQPHQAHHTQPPSHLPGSQAHTSAELNSSHSQMLPNAHYSHHQGHHQHQSHQHQPHSLGSGQAPQRSDHQLLQQAANTTRQLLSHAAAYSHHHGKFQEIILLYQSNYVRRIIFMRGRRERNPCLALLHLVEGLASTMITRRLL